MPDTPNSSGEFPDEPPSVFFSVGGSSDELEDKIDNQTYRNRLSAIISDEEQSTSEKLQAILQLGTEWFDVENGHLVRIDPAEGTHTITEVSGPHPKISPGGTADLSTTYCRRVIAGGDGMAIENAPEQGLAEDRAYQKFGFATYLGAKVVVGGELYGTVCFVDEEPRVESFSESDAAALALIVRTVGQELERGRREDRLRQTTARLEALFEDSPDMINIHDLEGNLILPNPRLCENTGYDEEALTDMKVWDLDRELSPEEAQALWAEMEPGDRQRREGQYRCKDGSTFPVEVDLRRLDLEDKQRFVVTSRDISERKEIERVLAETQARSESLINDVFEQLPGGVLVLDADLEVAWTNETIERFFGTGRGEMIGRSKAQLIEARIKNIFEEPERFAQKVLATYEDNTYTSQFECHVLPGSGRVERWLQHQSRPIRHGRYEGGRVEVYTDITERKKREQEVAEREARYRAIAESARDVIVTIDADSTIQFANPAVEEIFGYDPAELVGERLTMLMPERFRERHLEAIDRFLETGEQQRDWSAVEFPGLRKDGERIELSISFSAYEREGEIRFEGIMRDVTERKRREEALRRQKERFESLVQEVEEYAIFMLDPEGRIRSWNAGAERIKGYSEEEILGKPLSTFYTEEDREEGIPEENLTRAAAEGSAQDEGWRVRKDGTRFWADATLTALHEEDGTLRGFGKVTRDLTERRGRERRYEAIFNQTFQFTALMEPDGTLIEVNDTALEFGDLEEEEVLGLPLWETPWAQTGEASKRRLKDAVGRAAQGEFVRYEREIQGAEETRIVDFSIRPITDEEGEVSLLIPEARDITERKRQEQTLRDRQQKIEALYEATTQLLHAETRKEASASILNLVNEVFGYPLVGVRLAQGRHLIPDQLSPEVPEHMSSRTPLEIEGESVVAKAFRSGETAVFEDVRATSDPTDYGEARASMFVPIGEHGTISVGDLEVGTIDDYDRRLIEILSTPAAQVLDRIDREQELVEAKKEAEEASRLKSAMLTNMSHEIRTPLTAITGFAEILKGELEGRLGDFASRIYEGGQRLMKTLDSVLQLSKLDAGASELEREEVDLGPLAKETTEMLRPRAEEKSITLATALPDGPAKGQWNEDALNRIVENLLENAIKFTPEGGRVEVRAWEEEKEGILQVEDTGIGMDPGKPDELFEAFRQESEGLDREYEGSGLGLSIVRQLTEELGGTVEVDTEKGEGTCFTVRLPRAGDTQKE